MKLQRLRKHIQDLHGSTPGLLHLYYRFQLNNFMELLSVKILSLVPSLGLFFTVSLLQFQCVDFILSFYILSIIIP